MIARVLFVAFALAGLAALALPLVVRAEEGGTEGMRKVFPYPRIEQVLDNGLRIVVVPTDSPGLMAHYLAVRAGSRNEVEPGLSGFAHFFEHMMFRGTERHPADRYNAVLKRLGADSNAFTSDDWTCYHITAASSALETVMDIESDRFMNLEYTLEAFQKEAGAVLGEYNKNYSMPMMTLFEKLRDSAYAQHTYKHTTMGFLKDIEDMPNQYSYSLQFFDRWYRPDNCVLVVAGDVEPGRVFELARRYYGPWKRGAANVAPEKEPPQQAEKTAHLAWKNPTLPHVLLGFHMPAFDPDSVEAGALDVLAQVAFSETSPLYQDLVLDKQWVETLWGRAQDRRDPTLFLVMARVKETSKVDEVRDAVYSMLDRLRQEPLPASRIEAVKSHIHYAFLQSLDTPDEVAVTVANFMQLTGETSSLDRTFAALEKVTSADVQRVASRYFQPDNRTMVTLSFEKDARP